MKKKLSCQQRKRLNIIKNNALLNFKYKEAIEFYENLLKDYQLPAKDLCNLGLFYDHLPIFNPNEKKNRLKHEETALKYYKQAQRINSKELSVFEGLGRIWWHRKSKKSIAYYQEGLRLSQTMRKKSEFLEYLGNAYMSLDQTKRAIENYKKALKSKPISKFSLFNNLTFVYKEINKLPEA